MLHHMNRLLLILLSTRSSSMVSATCGRTLFIDALPPGHSATDATMSCSTSLCSGFAGIEDLREKREEVQKQIRDEEGEKAKLQQDLQVLTKRLAHINDGLARKVCWVFAQISTIMAPFVLQAYADTSCTWEFDQFDRACCHEQLHQNALANVLCACSA